jgi:small subunit ribosomal protein S3
MDAGALGVEIVVSGKLRTERARFEKFRAGYFPRCGEPALRFMRKAEVHVQLKPGIIGIRVKLMPPDAEFPDKIQIVEELPPAAEAPEAPPEELKKEVTEEAQETEKEAVEETAEETVEEKQEAPAEEANEPQATETAEPAESTESQKSEEAPQ